MLAKRLAFNNQKTFSKLIIRLAIAATAISVAVMIIASSAFNGFNDVITQKIFSLSGHIRITNREAVRINNAEETPFYSLDSVINPILKTMPEVDYVQPYFSKSGLLQSKTTIEGVLIKGVSSAYKFSALQPFLLSGTWPKFTDTGYTKEVCLSKKIADKLNVTVNDDLLLYVVQADQSRRTRKVKVCGIFKTGIDEYDSHMILADIGLVQKLAAVSNEQYGGDYISGEQSIDLGLKLDPDKPIDTNIKSLSVDKYDSTIRFKDKYVGKANKMISGYEIFLKDYKKMESVSNALFEAETFPVDKVQPKTIKEINQQIFEWLHLQDKTTRMLLVIMVIVAVLNLISCLIVLVLERVRMVGILKAVGAKTMHIQWVFIFNAMFIGAVGVLLGVVLGIGVCMLQQHFGFISLPEESYYVSKAIMHVNYIEVLVIVIATLCITFLVLLIPSILIRLLKPVKAINFK
jgi:lipoprotein-releasing system permease protein